MLLVVVVLAALTAAAMAVDWWAVAPGRDGGADRAEQVAKPAGLAGLLLCAAAAGAGASTEGRWLLVALALGLLGDVALLGSSTRRFVLGLSFFLVGHLAYVVSLALLGLDGGVPWAVAGAAVLVVALLAGREVLPAVLRDHGVALAVPVAAYTAVIGAMLVAGWATGSPVVAAGATVFVASDTLLARDRFVRPAPWAHLAVMVTYHLGQVLLVVGILAA